MSTTITAATCAPAPMGMSTERYATMWAGRGNACLVGDWASPAPLPDLRRCSPAQGPGRVRCRHPLKSGKAAMAQKVTVTLEDDLTGGPAEQTVRFAFDGTDYEIDLNAKNAAAFGKQLEPYLEHARKAGRAQPRRPGGPRPAVSAAVISGPGRRSTAWRSVSAAGSRPAWWSSTTQRPAGVNTTRHRHGPRTPIGPRGSGLFAGPSGPHVQ